MDVSKRNVFICGCPRSGTTALWRLLTAHKECVVGVERYGNLFFHPNFFSSNHFRKDRFFKVEQGDTFYNDLAQFSSYYKTAEQNFNGATFVGDKIPLLYNYFEALKKNFPDAIVLMIFRNIFDVAASYAVRASNPEDRTWSSSKGVASAIEDWTAAIAAYKKWAATMNISVIDYEKLFIEGAGSSQIFEKLDLQETPETIAQYTYLIARSAELEKNRSRALSSIEAKLIASKAPFGGYREVIANAI